MLVFAVSLGVAQGAATDPSLPDLVSDHVERPQIATYTQPDGDHLLIRFDGYLHNAGPGPLEVRGSDRKSSASSCAPSTAPCMKKVAQRIYKENNNLTPTDDVSRAREFLWEPADGHNHWHLKNAVRYGLWSGEQTAEVAPSQKVGFCLTDTEPIEYTGGDFGKYPIDSTLIRNCQDPAAPYNGGGSTASSVTTGISAGWRDKYTRSLAFQYVDITNVQPGEYFVSSQADPLNVLVEDSEANNEVSFSPDPVTVPGYLASPISAGVVSATAASPIELTSDEFIPRSDEEVEAGFDTLDPVRYKIVEKPKHGTLRKANGTSSLPFNSYFSDQNITYKADAGYIGPDSFKFVADDPSSSFPKNPAAATVALNVGSMPSVTISGAPSSLMAGLSAQLTALVIADDPPGVTWSVNGVPGGNAQVGTITQDGLYIAPQTVPLAGQVTIQAKSASGAIDQEVVRITPQPVLLPAPTPQGTPTVTVIPNGGGIAGRTKSKKTSLYGVRVGRAAGHLLVSVRSRKSGVVRIYATKGTRRVGSCRLKTVAARRLTCRIRLARGVSASKVNILLTLRVNGKLVESLKTNLASAKRSLAAHHAMGHQHH
jgi:hypothetical protein